MHTSTATYHPHQFNARKVQNCRYINATNALNALIKEFLDKYPDVANWLKDTRIRSKQEANWIVELLNLGDIYIFQSISSVQSGSERQNFTYIESNLGKGFIFYFVCRSCSRKAKCLYMPEGRWEYLCRNCHRLLY